MIQINLLPVRDIKRRAKAKKELTFACLIFGSFLTLLALVGIWLTMGVKNLQSELTAAQNEKRQYDAKLKEIDDLEKQKKVLEQNIAIINQLEQMSPTTVHVLDDVASRTPPDRIWLTDISKSGSQVQLTGMSLDNQTVAKYMLDLEDSPYLANLALVRSTTRKYADRDLKNFSLRSSITVPQKEQHVAQ